MTEILKKLMEQRSEAVGKARAILDAAEKESRNLNESEQAQYDGFDHDIDDLTARIQREERQAQREAELAAPAGGANPSKQGQLGASPEARSCSNPTDSAEYRSALIGYLASGMVGASLRTDRRAEEARTALGINIGTSSAGGVLAPAQMERVLMDYIKDTYVMRRICSVRTSANDVEIPYASGHVQAYHTAEAADYTASTPGFEKIVMGAFKATALTVVTEEALADIFINLESWLREDFGDAFGELEENDFVNGTGVGQPTGFLTGLTAGVTAASATDIKADEVLDLQMSLNGKFRQKGTFLTNDTTIKLLRKLKDGNGQYMWQPGMTQGAPSLLLGCPVETCVKMPTAAAGAKVIAFGDFSRYRILDRSGLYFQRLNELYAASGQVGFRAYRRYDGKLLDSNAIKLLTMNA